MPVRVFIFECNEKTQGDCFALQLFGTYEPWAKNVQAGDFCFLYNYTQGGNHFIYGVWIAKTGCAWHDRKAWDGGYQNQVRVERISKELMAVPRWSVKHIVEHLVGERTKVRHELDSDRAQNLLQFYASDFNIRVRSGQQMNQEDKVYFDRYPLKEEWRCMDGHIVRSQNEKTIDDYLARRVGRHDYEYLLPLPDHLYPDFTVYTADHKPVFIEFWGMLNDPDYVSRKNRKCEIYARHCLPLIELHRDDLRDLDRSLLPKLRERGVPILL